MSYNKEEIKITKKEKNDSESLIKNIKMRTITT